MKQAPRFILIVMLFANSLVSQNLTFQGKLVDKETKQPVVYANLSFLKSNKGVSTDEKGNFSMNLPKELLQYKIHISCLNYKDTIVFARQLQEKRFELTPKSILLNEVILQRNLERLVTLGRVKNEVFGVHTTGLRMLAKYFAKGKRTKCCNYIDKVSIHFSDRSRHRKKSKFRIRIFGKDSRSGLPKEDLLTVNLPVEIMDGQKQVDIDLSSYSIEMPDDGIFIAFEKLFIPFNAYGKNDNKDENEQYYAPIIGYTKYAKADRNENFYFFSKGEWKRSPLNKAKGMKKYAPAISLTLSN